jgi:Family of unknown function (DUF5681)
MNNSATNRDDKGQFLQGVSGNKAGRPKGSRNKLGERFLDDLLEAWEDRGRDALVACATKEPAQFCKIVANILPKEVLLTALLFETGSGKTSKNTGTKLLK